VERALLLAALQAFSGHTPILLCLRTPEPPDVCTSFTGLGLGLKLYCAGQNIQRNTPKPGRKSRTLLQTSVTGEQLKARLFEAGVCSIFRLFALSCL